MAKKSNSERDPELNEIQELAERIEGAASTLDKKPRHAIANLARLINWLCYDFAHPGDPEARAAIDLLKSSLGKSDLGAVPEGGLGIPETARPRLSDER